MGFVHQRLGFLPRPITYHVGNRFAGNKRIVQVTIQRISNAAQLLEGNAIFDFHALHLGGLGFAETEAVSQLRAAHPQSFAQGANPAFRWAGEALISAINILLFIAAMLLENCCRVAWSAAIPTATLSCFPPVWQSHPEYSLHAPDSWHPWAYALIRHQ